MVNHMFESQVCSLSIWTIDWVVFPTLVSKEIDDCFITITVCKLGDVVRTDPYYKESAETNNELT